MKPLKFMFAATLAFLLASGCEEQQQPQVEDADISGHTVAVSELVQVPGAIGPIVSFSGEAVQIAILSENTDLIGEGEFNEYDLPGSADSSLLVAAAYSNNDDDERIGTVIMVSVSVADLADENLRNSWRSMGLPGGGDLPSIEGGNLPAMDLASAELGDVRFYLNEGHLGVFVPHQLESGNGVTTFSYGNHSEGRLGILGQDTQGDNPGLLLLLDIDEYLGGIPASEEEPEVPAPTPPSS